jgi:hypothetical protein
MFSKKWPFRPRRSNTSKRENEHSTAWRGNTAALASSVDHLCNLCDDLLAAVKRKEITSENDAVLDRIPAQIDAIRRSAAYIAAEVDPERCTFDLLVADPYSLEALRRMVSEK